jgi:hypothetical protein
VADTYPETSSFSNFIVEVEFELGIWSAPCGFTTKSLNMSASTSSATVPSCNNPEAAAWDVKGVDTLSGQVQGAGVMAKEDSPKWEGWYDSATTRRVRQRIPGVGYRMGPGLLTALGASTALKSDGNLVQRSVTIDSAGPWPWTAGNPADVTG